MKERTAKEIELRDYLINRLTTEIPYSRLNGDKVRRLPNNVNVSFQFIEGESMLLMLDQNGICGSSGSACTSGSLDPSHVLLAIGLPNGISSLLAGFASSFSNRLLVTHGTAAVAAMAAAGKTTMVISMIVMAICMGCQPLLAYSYGAGDAKRLKQLLKNLILLTVVFGVLAGAASFAGRNALIRMFIKEEGAFRLGTQLVTYLVLGSPVIGLTYLATNLLQSVGRASGAVVLSLLRQGLLLIPLLYLMNALGGVQGIAAAHLMADVGAAAISAGILLHGLRASVEKTAKV